MIETCLQAHAHLGYVNSETGNIFGNFAARSKAQEIVNNVHECFGTRIFAAKSKAQDNEMYALEY